jgi:hypothetical protein
VQLGAQGLIEQIDIPVLDVAAVFAQMDNDSVGPAQFGQVGGMDWVRLMGQPGLADGGYVVDIDNEIRH